MDRFRRFAIRQEGRSRRSRLLRPPKTRDRRQAQHGRDFWWQVPPDQGALAKEHRGCIQDGYFVSAARLYLSARLMFLEMRLNPSDHGVTVSRLTPRATSGMPRLTREPSRSSPRAPSLSVSPCIFPSSISMCVAEHSMSRRQSSPPTRLISPSPNTPWRGTTMSWSPSPLRSCWSTTRNSPRSLLSVGLSAGSSSESHEMSFLAHNQNPTELIRPTST